jgi:integrase/recombinase XerD
MRCWYVADFNKNYIWAKKRSTTYQGPFINTIKLFYEKTPRKKLVIEHLERPRKDSPLPEVLNKVFQKAKIKAGITQPCSLHTLRHCYATHLLKSGTDIRYIQALLGHKHSKTTKIYTHVTTKSIQKIKSPFDDMEI